MLGQPNRGGKPDTQMESNDSRNDRDHYGSVQKSLAPGRVLMDRDLGLVTPA